FLPYNMPSIEGMANIITVCLGRNIRFNLVVQAYAQIKNKYGDDADTIDGNCGNTIYILTNDQETAEKVS
ncbi:TraM recognition domain-containing protein, partial [Bacillus mycoides]|uniref:TraM recognition domain-containing protein n=1 Tax=Bacillus mycoides TaxID=1405 RepID=UPI00113B1F5E